MSNVLVFIDPALPNRASALKSLKSLGAKIATTPRAATILVVGRDVSGRQFLRDWKNENKTIVYSGWVRKSVEDGQLLDEQVNWGDFLAVDDGNPIASGAGSDSDQEGENENHRSIILPTPRTTPSSVDANFTQQLPTKQRRKSNLSPKENAFPPIASTSQWSDPANHPTPDALAALPTHLLQAAIMSQMQHNPVLQHNFNLAAMDSLQQRGLVPSQLPSSSSSSSSFQQANSWTEANQHNSNESASSFSHTASPIFKKAGKSLNFYVTPTGFRDRKDLVFALKKNGGAIVSATSDADIVIAVAGSTPIGNLPTLRRAFVTDSVAAGRMLDPDDYPCSQGAPQKVLGKRSSEQRDTPARTSSAPISTKKVKVEKVPVASGSIERKTKQEGKGREKSSEQAVSQLKGRSKSMSQAPSRMRSLSPLPPENITEQSGGKYLYTEEEKAYALKYIERLFQKDHQIGYMDIARALNIKMPHHTEASWRRSLDRFFPMEIASMEKRAGIAYRRSLAAKAKEEEEEEREDKTAAEEVEEEITFLCAFFQGPDYPGDEDPEYAWDMLTQKRKCKTAKSWKEFWDVHGTKVTERMS